MKLYFDELVHNVLRERISGKSFGEIADRYFLRDAAHAQTIYEWKTSTEPIEWKQQLIDLEYLRLDDIQLAFWHAAKAGDVAAAKVVLQTSALKKSYIEQRKPFDPARASEIEKLLIEQRTDMDKLGQELREQVAAMNEVLKDFNFSDI